MRILLLTDNFVPETNSPARRAHEHAKAWAKAGNSVTVITSVPNFPTGKVFAPYSNRLLQRERIDGIEVVRVWTLLAPNRGVVLRSLDFLSFAVSSFFAGLSERPDIIIATSPQLLTGLAGWMLSIAKKKPWIFEVRDLWPDSIVAVGVMRENGYVRALRWLEQRLYKHASRIVAVSEGLRDRIAARGVAPEKISVVSNGVDRTVVVPRPKDQKLLDGLGLRGAFVVGYVGTHGLAQSLDTVLHAADILKGGPERFLFVGEGARRNDLIRTAEELKLENVRFVGLISSDAAMDHVAACDAILIPLRRSTQLEITIPAKIFEAAAMERPMIVSAEGASAALVERYQAGILTPPEDAKALADAILRLRGDEDLRARLTEGCRALARDFDRSKLAGDMLEQIRLSESG